MFTLLVIFGLFSNGNHNSGCSENLQKFVSSTPYIVEAEIEDVSKPPTNWSRSFIFNYQIVTYKVNKVLKGSDVADTISVGHAIVKGLSTVDGKNPQLSRDIFFVGSKLILFVDATNSKTNSIPGNKKSEFIESDGNCIEMPSSESNIKRVNSILNAEVQR